MRYRRTLGLAALLTATALAACGSDTEPPGAGDSGFESDDPRLTALRSQAAYDEGRAPTLHPFLHATATGGDFVAVEGNRLYAYSPSGDLSIIDLGSNDEPQLLGRTRVLPAEPLQAYLQGHVLLSIHSNPDSVEPKGSIVAIDTSDPENVREVGRFEVPARIMTSRVVGNVLYVVGWDWIGEKVFVSSLDVTDPSAIATIDEASIPAPRPAAVSFTNQRVVVTIPNDKEGATSTIRIIELEGANGGLALGGSATLQGYVSETRHVDEHEGVLRVLGQSDVMASPTLQTFEIGPNGELQPLGSLELSFPQHWEMRIRFDGTQAYVTTTGDQRSLLTLDLANPKTPMQTGELTMSLEARHVEKRGDRLYVFGLDGQKTNAVLNVSIIDVSDPSKPVMLDRVDFGGAWGWYPKDFHDGEATRFIDEGILLVPFSAYVYGESCHRHVSGVQIVEIAGDELTKRGVVLSRGRARRAFLQEGRLVDVSEEQVQVFDIDDRDQPKDLATMAIGHRVDRTLPHGEHVVRIGIDPWTKIASLEIVRAEDADVPEPLGSIEIGQALAGSHDPACGYDELYRDPFLRLFAEDNRIYVVTNRGVWQHGQHGTTVSVVDIEDPTAPRILMTQHYDFSIWAWDETGQNEATALIEGGGNIVQVGHVLAAIKRNDDPLAQQPHDVGDTLHVLDLRDPDAPKHETVALPPAVGRTKLHAQKGALLLGHWVPVENKPGRVRFYLDRIDLSDGPVLRSSVNIPGSFLHYDDESRRYVTVDYRRETSSGHTEESCRPWIFDVATGTCTIVHRTLRLLEITGDTVTIVDDEELADDLEIVKVIQGDDRITLAHGERDDAIFWDCEAGFYCGDSYDGDSLLGKGLLVVGGIRTGELELVSPKLAERGFARLAGSGKWLVTSRKWGSVAKIVDLRSLDQIIETEVSELPGIPKRISTDGERAYFSLGVRGLTTVALPE